MIIKKIRSHIAEGKTELALQEFMAVSEEYGASNIHNEAILLSGEYQRIQSDFRRGFIKHPEKEAGINRINYAIMGHFDDIAILEKKPKQSQT